MACALRLLGARARSGAEVKGALKRRGAADTVIEAVLAKLRRLSYLDDRAFARNWALSRSENQGYGPGKIKQELSTKGVAEGQINAVIKELFTAEGEAAKAKKILYKRFKREDLADTRVLRRAAGYLQRRGYSSQVIFSLLGQSVDDYC
jgi:regulatory protein